MIKTRKRPKLNFEKKMYAIIIFNHFNIISDFKFSVTHLMFYNLQ